ncbi:arylesterase [Marinomonas agarivorans]|nr:arylesterase [Marinomonas agarivorans]
MGDSLSAAYQLPIKKGWVALLEQQLQTDYPDLHITNASISGETTQGGRSRLPDLLAKNQPDIVILELGANDALRGYPLTKTKENLLFMINAAQQSQAKVLLLGNRIPPNYGKRYSEAFFKLFQELAEQHKLTLVPFMLDKVALNPELMLPDGLHPNAEGQIKVLENIMPVIRPLLMQK